MIVLRHPINTRKFHASMNVNDFVTVSEIFTLSRVKKLKITVSCLRTLI